MVGVLLVLLPSAVMLGCFGVENVGSALTYPGRIMGAVLVAFALVTLLGAGAVVDHWYRNCFSHSGLVALAGAAAALLANAMLLYEVINGDSIGYLVLYWLLTAGSLWAVIMVWRTLTVIPTPKRVAAAVIVSTIVPLTNWSYQNLYQPGQLRSKPLVTMTVGKPMLSQDRKAFSLPVDIRLQNRSDVGFYVLGAEFHVMGERVLLSPHDRLRAQWRADAEQWSRPHETHPLARREIHQPGELVAAHPWASSGKWVEAGDELYTRTVVQLPADTPYDQLAFYANVSLARKDRLGLEQMAQPKHSWSGGKVPSWIAKDLDSIIHRSRVHENNAIDEHTMDPRYVTVYWAFGPHGAQVITSITRKGEEDRELSKAETREVVNRYGLLVAGSGPYERTLWDVKSQR
ncbi:hypothetical protein [Streptomyces sp. NPDC002328]|uniref:hypothetical protein n=1 Tax=Streptomyces sp. NPDC002328 TaxID=3364642 RepID=UPI0036CC4A99